VGRALLSDQASDVSSGELWVGLTDSADYNAAIDSVGRVLRGYPGLRSQLQTYPQDQVRVARTGTDAPLVVRVYGIEMTTLQGRAQEVLRRIASVNGVVEPKVQAQDVQPTLEVQVDLASVQRYGLVPGDVRRAASTFFSGLLVGNLYQEQKIFDVVVWGTPSTRHTPYNLTDLMIDTPSGGQVRLGDVATVRIVPYPTAIRHDASSRYVDVTAQVSGRDLDQVVADVSNRVRTVPMPLEYHAEVLGDLAQQQTQDRRTIALAIAVAAGILLLLQAAFGSWRRAALVLLTLPLALTGGVLTAALAGAVMSVGALAGLFAVLAIAARNAVVLVRGCQRLEDAGGVAPDAELVVRATRERLGPVLLTAAAVAMAMLPLVVLGSTAGTEVLQPLAAVVLGGLVTSTLLTLYILPALYLRWFRDGHPEPAEPGRHPSNAGG
jgi:Cu/Ag efflux pump CusA